MKVIIYPLYHIWRFWYHPYIIHTLTFWHLMCCLMVRRRCLLFWPHQWSHSSLWPRALPETSPLWFPAHVLLEGMRACSSTLLPAEEWQNSKVGRQRSGCPGRKLRGLLEPEKYSAFDQGDGDLWMVVGCFCDYKNNGSVVVWLVHCLSYGLEQIWV